MKNSVLDRLKSYNAWIWGGKCTDSGDCVGYVWVAALIGVRLCEIFLRTAWVFTQISLFSVFASLPSNIFTATMGTGDRGFSGSHSPHLHILFLSISPYNVEGRVN